MYDFTIITILENLFSHLPLLMFVSVCIFNRRFVVQELSKKLIFIILVNTLFECHVWAVPNCPSLLFARAHASRLHRWRVVGIVWEI